jgi:DNA-binding SARP family transcriptional activator
MTVLRISLLGSFHASGDHEGEIPFTNRKVMGLLAFLALEAGQAHSRETLMGLLWPEMSEADARNNLRVTLARLRKQLEGVTAVSPLTTSRTDVRFQLNDAVTLDAANFHMLLAQTENHTHADRTTCAGCRQRLAAAAALYHGPLLHGLYLDDCPAFDEWLFVQRERFHLQALEVLEELAQGLAADGRFAEAAAHTRRQLELDPLHDSAQRRLLRLLAYQGQTAAALSQFEAIKKTLHAELGIEPDVELLQLAQQIKDGTLPLPDTGAAKAVTSREATAVSHHNLPEILTPFIGRETELAQLAERLAAADYRLITLAGPGGIGKTRLALEAARANLHRFADGAFFVPLDGVAQASEIPAAIAAALNLTFSSEAAPAAELLRILQEKQLLLVVDNLEHIIEEGAALLLQIVQARRRWSC